MKKILAIASVAILSLSLLAGCGNSNTPGGDKKTIKVGVALYKFDDTFISTVRTAIEAEAKAIAGKDSVTVDLNFQDGQGQQATQNDQIDTFITQGVDVLAVNMVDRTAASVIIEKAKAKNIPVVFFNREPVKEDMAKWDKLYYVGAKAEESGTMQGQIVADYWKKTPAADKNGDGKIQYVMLEGEPGHQDAILRTQFSIKALDEAGIKSEKLASDTGMWQRANGQEKMAAWLSSFGDKIEVVFANNDDMGLGAIEALKGAGYFKDNKFMPVVSVDATAPALDSLEQNLLFGTVLNDAENQGKSIINIAYALATGKEVSSAVKDLTDGKYKWVPYQMVTKENFKNFK